MRRLFALANDATMIMKQVQNTKKKYFLSRAKVEHYNVLIDGRNFYDQPINDLISQYDEVRKVHGDNYTTGCLLDYTYFKDNWLKTNCSGFK